MSVQQWKLKTGQQWVTKRSSCREKQSWHDEHPSFPVGGSIHLARGSHQRAETEPKRCCWAPQHSINYSAASKRLKSNLILSLTTGWSRPSSEYESQTQAAWPRMVARITYNWSSEDPGHDAMLRLATTCMGNVGNHTSNGAVIVTLSHSYAKSCFVIDLPPTLI